MIGYRLEKIYKSAGTIDVVKWTKFYLKHFRLTVENNRASLAVEELTASPQHMNLIKKMLPYHFITIIDDPIVKDLARAGIINEEEGKYTFANNVIRYLCQRAAVSTIGINKRNIKHLSVTERPQVLLFSHPLELFTVAFPLLEKYILSQRMFSENYLQYYFFSVAQALLPTGCIIDPEIGQDIETHGHLDFFILGCNVNWAIEFVVSTSETNVLEHCKRFVKESEASHQILVNFCTFACVDLCWLQRETNVLIVHCVISPDYSKYELVYIAPDLVRGKTDREMPASFTDSTNIVNSWQSYLRKLYWLDSFST